MTDATTESDHKRLGVTPAEVAAVLHTVGQGSKHLSRSREEFVVRVTAATHLVLAGFRITRQRP